MADHAAVVVVGASAGGIEALTQIARQLPDPLALAVVVVLHLAPTGPSALPSILARQTSLDVSAVQDDEPVRRGHVHVAPPGWHVLLEGGRLRLSAGPRVNGLRPAVDPTMQSAARAYFEQSAGLVLSGTREDGAAGLAAIADAGGAVAVQDPDESQHAGMPRAALRAVPSASVLGVGALAGWIAALAPAASTATDR